MKAAIKKSIFCTLAALVLISVSLTAVAQNALTPYTGTYERMIGNYHATVIVSIKNNKLQAKQSWDGKVRIFEQVGDNRFIITLDGWAVEFMRNKQKKVTQMIVLGNEVWVKRR